MLSTATHLEKPDASCQRPAPAGSSRVARSVLVIGAGPAGLAAAACLKEQGIEVDLVDRLGKPAGAYGRLDGGIILSSPAVFTQLPGLPIQADTQYITIAQYREYLFRYAEHFDLKPLQRTVESIERTGQRFAVRFAGDDHTWIYESVVTATGMCDYPSMPRIDGLDSDELSASDRVRVMHSCHWPGHAAMADQRILIVGGASSAIAIAEQCAAAGTAVTLSIRRQRLRFSWARVLGVDLRRWIYPLTRRLPRWMFGQRCGLRPSFTATDQGFRKFKQSRLIAVRGQVQRFDGKEAVFDDGGRRAFDVVVFATGYHFNTPFLPAEVARAEGGQPLADRGESRSWAGLHFIGIPCGRTVASEFLHGMAADAPRIARRISERLHHLAESSTAPA